MVGIALAGAGAFGEKHLDGLKNIDGVEIVSIISLVICLYKVTMHEW